MNSSRVTQSMIAAKAGVTTMTVSNVLRGKHNVSEDTRQRIMRLAEAMGYVPDPYVAQLMEHLRQSRSSRQHANLAYLAGEESDYSRELFVGARERVVQLGYHLEWIATETYAGKPRRFRKVLRSRGIEGLLLGPLALPGEIRFVDDWSDFSVVSLSHSIRRPRFDTVVPNQFYNTIELLRQVRRAGARRPSLVTVREFDERVNHAFTAAFAWDAYKNGQHNVHIFECDSPVRSELSKWLAKVQPDCAIFPSDEHINLFLTSPAETSANGIAVVSLARGSQESDGFPGIDQDSKSTGKKASEILIRHIQQRVVGVPEHAVVTMNEGAWQLGRGFSFRPCSLGAKSSSDI